MQIAISAISDQNRNSAYAIAAVAGTVYCYSYALVYGPIMILTVYGLWFLPLALRPGIFKVAPGDLLIYSVPLLALASAFWSDHPDISLRFSIQLITTVALAAIAAHVVAPSNLSRGLLLGCFITAFQSFMEGSVHGEEGGDGALKGLFGSKNQLGLVAAIGITAAICHLSAYRTTLPVKVLYWVAVAIMAWILFLAQSVTSLISIAAALMALGAVSYLRRLPQAARAVFVPWAMVGIATLLIIAAISIPTAEIYELLGKDPTMSGRTDIWEVGYETSAANPVLGVGYQAFWVPGNVAAERLWEQFLIPDKTGFHFHNAFIQVLVELGLFGFLAFAFTIVLILFREGVALFLGKVPRRLLIYMPLTVFFVSRTTSEIDFYGQFGIGTFIVYFIAVQTARTLGGRVRTGARSVRRPRFGLRARAARLAAAEAGPVHAGASSHGASGSGGSSLRPKGPKLLGPRAKGPKLVGPADRSSKPLGPKHGLLGPRGKRTRPRGLRPASVPPGFGGDRTS
ncbi:O-antigen ligase family protein [Mongoliimonas terrestris]|uniref:O-antigen ligase family protein n=1 Tax=Mongoliimonas terrestris TaxID=1709001 RepID=UPI0009495A5B|nr:O-antigen ligase [Mongoliimonas terrestris]